MTAESSGWLSHPFDAAEPQAVTYRHGMTFTWTRGDACIAVQRGRVANCKRVRVLTDQHPGVDLLTGRQPIIDRMPAPANADSWNRADVMGELADRWLELRRAQIRRTA